MEIVSILDLLLRKHLPGPIRLTKYSALHQYQYHPVSMAGELTEPITENAYVTFKSRDLSQPFHGLQVPVSSCACIAIKKRTERVSITVVVILATEMTNMHMA